MMKKLHGESAKNRRETITRHLTPRLCLKCADEELAFWLNADFQSNPLLAVVFESEEDARRGGTLPNPG
jgi:hypothetical protein